MRHSSLKIIKPLIFSFLLVFFLTSCNCCPSICLPCFKGCRRPPVIVNRDCCVIDYEPCLLCNDDQEEEKSYDVTEEMVNENPNTSGESYRLAVGDVISVRIFGDTDIGPVQVTVAPDGYIYYASLNGVYAKGKTLSDVRFEIENQLKELYLTPNVTLNLTSANDYTFTILGKVNRPGVYPIADSLRLREAIGIAGGIQKERFFDKQQNSEIIDLVDLERSFVIRDNEKIRPDFESLLESCANNQNMFIKPGDYIFLAPKRSDAIYVIGSAITPNRIPYTKHLTISEAVAKGRGWSTDNYQFKAANLSKVLIVRGSLKCPRTVEVDILKIMNGEARDFYLMPGDIVYLQNKELRFGRELVKLAIRTFISSFGLSAGDFWGLEWFPNE